MGTKVFANGRAVATTTSGHIAMNDMGVHDIRLKGTALEPRLSKVLSTQLKKGASKKTLFDKGEVWRKPTECGPPSFSKPDDKLPGKSNGAVVNGEIIAADGSGSPNVFVEGEKVECHHDITRQNMGPAGHNSMGKIVDEAEAKAIEEAFDRFMAERARLAEEKRKQEAAKRAAEVDRLLAQQKANPTPPAKVDTTALQKLGIEGVIVSDLEGGSRVQGLANGPADPKMGAGPYLEVLNNSLITIEVLGPGAANAFIRTPAGERKGPKTTYRSGNKLNQYLDLLGGTFGTESMVGDFIYAGFKDYFACGEEPITVTAADVSAGAFTRTVVGLPTEGIKIDLDSEKIKGKVKDWKDNVEKFMGFVRRVNGAGAFQTKVEIAFLEGKLSFSAAWKEDAGKHTCPFELEIECGITLIKASVTVKIPLTILFPACQAVVDVINAIARFLGFADSGIFAFVKLSGSIGGSGKGSLKCYRQPNQPSVVTGGSIACDGKIGVSVGLALELSTAVKGSCSIDGDVTAKYPFYPKGGPLDVKAKLELVAKFEVKIGWFKIGDSWKYPLAEADIV